MSSAPQDRWAAYRRAFRADAHQLLAWGFSDARDKLGSNLEETQITGFIAEAMERRLDNESTPERFDRYEVVEEYVLPDDSRTGKARRRADFRVKSNLLRPRPRYIFEAKRLRMGSHPVGTYLGDEGLKRFLEKTSYSEHSDVAGLIGYVQSDTPDSWLARIDAALQDDAEGKYGVITTLHDSDEVAYFTHWKLSTHRRAGGEVTELTHILLNCCEETA